MSKYDPLRRYLATLSQTEWTASFEDVEAVLGTALPPSARAHRPWWANTGGNMVHQLAWLTAGWRAESVDLTRGTVRFIRTRIGGMMVSPAAQPGVTPLRPRSQAALKPVRGIVSAIEREQRMMSVNVTIPAWRLLGAAERTEDGWRLPLAEPSPALCRLHVFEESGRRQVIVAVEDARAFLSVIGVTPTRTNGRKGREIAVAAEIADASQVVTEIVYQDQIFLIQDGASRKADLANPAERKLVEAAVEVASPQEQLQQLA